MTRGRINNIPGGREHAVNWIDALGNLWLFGGAGFDSTGTQGSLNDLWKYQTNLPSTTYTVGGTVSGLTGTGLVLQDNGGNNLAVSTNGSFTFSNSVASGAAYSVTVLTQPTGQSCTVSSGSGTASANVTNVQVTCSTTTYTIGGTISGLTASGLVLADGSQTVSPASGATSFTFPTAIASGSSYAVTVKTQPSGETCTITNGSGTASANVSSIQVTCTTTTYTIGGTVSGLTGTGLVLQDNGGNNLAVSASGSFTFSTAIASGAAYSVTVFTQPTGQSCTVTNGSGTASANVSNVQVSCIANATYTIGGTVSGLTGTGLVLQNNGGNNKAVSASGSFTFSTAVASGSTYGVTVFTQPTGQSCTVTSGSGTANANVSNVQVTCSTTTYTIGVTVSGLTGTGLVLQDNGGNNLPVSANGSYIFTNSVATGSTYSVTVFTQPTGQSCTVTYGSGTASANVSNVQVSCIANATYTIGVTVSGLTGTGLVLQDNGGNNLPVSVNGSFVFTNSVASGATYSVTVVAQPTGQTCAVTYGSGTASANVTNVQVACLNVYYTIDVMVSGLTGTRLVLQNNGGNNLTVSANGSFIFSNSVARGASYYVTVLTQPTGQICTVTNGSGTASANVTNVQVTCLNLYTIGGTVSGLSGQLALLNNGIDMVVMISNGGFTFSVASGATYNITVFSSGYQTCTVTNGSGTANANVSNVQVTCTTPTYTISGTVSGLTDTGLVLQDNGGNNKAVSANGTFTFSNSIDSGSTYSVTVFNQATGQSCIATNSSGTVSANVTNVQVTCWTNVSYGGTWTWMGGSNSVGLTNSCSPGVYGTLGTATLSNIPGGRSPAASWTDESGNLWLFGGDGCDMSNGLTQGLNDLWKFNPALGALGEWTWMGGSDTYNQSGVYGTLGTTASTNIPGAREVAVTWSDASGNLWLLGGSGFDSTGNNGWLNDLWKFSPSLGSNGEWTWMAGSSTLPSASNSGIHGVYGTLGTPAAANTPGGRGSAMSWSDASGNLWLFGGWCIDSAGIVNDLWKFNPKLGTYGEWTWMGGSSSASILASSGVYGTLGTAASTNIPGAREGAVTWSDASGNLWLFGGSGLDSIGYSGWLNDLWKFDPKLGIYGEWTWMGGSNMVDANGAAGGQTGIYGTLGTAASTNIPGGREGAVTWSDASGNLWLFGGYGFDSTGTQGSLNDLWEFNPALGALGEWTWMGGINSVGDTFLGQSGVYGILGTAAASNVPGGRDYAVSWTDGSGNRWLFGGYGWDSTEMQGFLNDMWEFKP